LSEDGRVDGVITTQPPVASDEFRLALDGLARAFWWQLRMLRHVRRCWRGKVRRRAIRAICDRYPV
jgi:hypothetical protein